MYDITGAPDNSHVKFRQSFGPLRAIGQLRLQYADGSTDVIATDMTWQAGPSPITFENQFAGEDYDARLEIAGWDRPGLQTDTKWKKPVVVPGPGGALRGLSCAAPTIRTHDILAPVIPPCCATTMRP
jgi:alpha-L-rhamnosidase